MDPTCFTCGLALTDPPRLNHLSSGAVCPSCRDRLLEVLPSLLPGGDPGLAREAHPELEGTLELGEEQPAEGGAAPRAKGPRQSHG